MKQSFSNLIECASEHSWRRWKSSLPPGPHQLIVSAPIRPLPTVYSSAKRRQGVNNNDESITDATHWILCSQLVDEPVKLVAVQQPWQSKRTQLGI